MSLRAPRGRVRAEVPQSGQVEEEAVISLQGCGSQGSPNFLRIVSSRRTGTAGLPSAEKPPSGGSQAAEIDKWQVEENDRRGSLL